jgi:hypothetical protein
MGVSPAQRFGSQKYAHSGQWHGTHPFRSPDRMLNQPGHYPLIFAAVLAVLGFIMAYQIHRVRVLSRYFEQQRMPIDRRIL